MMERKILTIPRMLMASSSFTWEIDWRGQGSEESNSGFVQTVYNAFPRWYGTPQLVLKPEDILAWRAVKTSARGRVNLYRVPIIDGISIDYADIPPQFEERGIPFDTRFRFDTGQGFEYQPYHIAKEFAPKGSSTLVVDTSPLPEKPPQIGQILSHDDLPFVVTEVLRVDDTTYELRVEMPLRSDVAAGNPIDLIPYGLFVMTTDRVGATQYGPNLFARPTLSFVEYLR